MAELVDRGIENRYVDAARRLTEETGSAAFTVQQVVAMAGGSLKGFYRDFAGKDDLLCAMLAEDCTDGAAILHSIVDHELGSEARVHAWVRGLFTLMTMGELNYVGVLVREHHRLSNTRPDEHERAIAPLIAVLTNELEAGGDRDAASTAGWMFQLVLDTIQNVVLGRVDDRDQLVERLWQFCWGGISGRLW